ncbi:hypothetical protein Tco_1425220 [Tanacetum coccineum]
MSEGVDKVWTRVYDQGSWGCRWLFRWFLAPKNGSVGVVDGGWVLLCDVYGESMGANGDRAEGCFKRTSKVRCRSNRKAGADPLAN